MSALKYIAVTLLGVGAGFAAGYLWQKKRYEKEITDFKAEYKKKNEKVTEEAKKTAERNEELKAKVKETLDMARYEEALKQAKYDTRSSHIGSEDEQPRWEKKEEPKEKRRLLKEGEPYVINMSEFEDPDFAHYDKYIEFEMYEDGTVLDETGEAMSKDDILDTIGWEYERWFKENPHEDACYVRNEESQIDYTVVRRNGSYSGEEV